MTTTSEVQQGESISFGFPVTYTPARTGVAGRLEGVLLLANTPHRGTVFARGCLEELARGAEGGIPLTGLAGELLATVRGPDLVLAPNSASLALELPAGVRGSPTDQALRGEGGAPGPLSLYVEYLLLARPTPLHGPVSRRVHSIRPIGFRLGALPPEVAEPTRAAGIRAAPTPAPPALLVLKSPPGPASVVRLYGKPLVIEPDELVGLTPAEDIGPYLDAGFTRIDPASLAPEVLQRSRRRAGASTTLSLTTRTPAAFRLAGAPGGELGQVAGLVVEYERLDQAGAAFGRESLLLGPASPTSIRLAREQIPLVDAAGTRVGVVRQLKAQRAAVWAAADLVDSGAGRLVERAFAEAGGARNADLGLAARVLVRERHSEPRPGKPPVAVYDRVELIEVAVRRLVG